MEYRIADCLSSTDRLSIIAQIVKSKEILYHDLLDIVKHNVGNEAYKSLSKQLKQMIDVGLVLSKEGLRDYTYYSATPLSIELFDRLDSSYEMNDPNSFEAIAGLFYILSKEDRVTIIETVSGSKGGIEVDILNRSVDHLGSLSYNIDLLDEAGIIQKTQRITSGKNMDKAIIAIEILRAALIVTQDKLRSSLPLVNELFIPITAHRKLSNSTVQEALNILTLTNTPYLLVGDTKDEAVALSKYDITIALTQGYTKLNGNLKEEVKSGKFDNTIKKISLDTIISDPIINQILHGHVGTVVDSSGKTVGILTADEIVNMFAFLYKFIDNSDFSKIHSLSLNNYRCCTTAMEVPYTQISNYLNDYSTYNNIVLWLSHMTSADDYLIDTSTNRQAPVTLGEHTYTMVRYNLTFQLLERLFRNTRSLLNSLYTTRSSVSFDIGKRKLYPGETVNMTEIVGQSMANAIYKAQILGEEKNLYLKGKKVWKKDSAKESR